MKMIDEKRNRLIGMMVRLSKSSGMSFLDYREAEIKAFTGGVKSRTHELDLQETEAMIHMCQDKLSGSPQKGNGDRIRKTIFRCCYEMKVISSDLTSQEKVSAINEYIAQHPKIGLKKELNKYSFSELQALCYQFEVFYKHFLSKVKS